jgi:hypothetical protein
MDEVVPKGKAKIVKVVGYILVVQMSHNKALFLLSNSSNFYMDIYGKVLYIHN